MIFYWKPVIGPEGPALTNYHKAAEVTAIGK